MSTQSPTPPTPKGSRNNRRSQKKNATPATQKVTMLTTPPSSPPRAVSPRETATDSSNSITLSKKKANRSNKKPREVSKASPFNPAYKSGHRHTSSHPSNNINTPQLKDSPHYAGPTFHASPAPSALPIPSFFSKSLPESDVAPALDPDSDSFEAEPDFESTPSKSKARPQVPNEGQESTPLDFLFKAAVEARKSQSQRSPEPTARVRSPQTDSKALQQRRFNTNGAIGVFPLEMDGPDQRNSSIGPSFAPSYKDRMNALRASSSPSPPATELDEDQRRAKTEALKSLLLNPRPQRPSSGSPSPQNQVNCIAKQLSPTPQVPHFATPLRATSGPPTTSGPCEQKRARSGPESSLFSPIHASSPQKPQSQACTLKRDVLSSVYGTSFQSQACTLKRDVLSPSPGNVPGASNETHHSPNPVYDYSRFSGNHIYSRPPTKSPVSRTLSASAGSQVLDTKKMEDDLRRILKLDVNPGIPSSGMQSSFA